MASLRPSSPGGRAARAAVLCVALAVVAVIAVAGPAGAHPIPPGYNPLEPSPLTIKIDSITPNLSPAAFVIDADSGLAQFSVTATSGHDIVILGYDGEPYLHIDAKGNVFTNEASPATYINSSTSGGDSIPASASAKSPPQWQQVPGNETATWHDHRIHWMVPTPPTTLANSDVAQTFEIHLLVDQQPVTVTGALHYDAQIPWSNYQIAVGGASGGASTSSGGVTWPLVAGGVLALALVVGAGLVIVRAGPARPPRPRSDSSPPAKVDISD